MLHQISWFTYGVGVISITIIYYLLVSLSFYRTEIRTTFHQLTGKRLAPSPAGTGDFQIPDYSIMGQAQPEPVEFVAADELSFAPAELPDNEEPEVAPPNVLPGDNHLISDFSEMVSEAKTLIRVINESSESKENFEMLFRLIIQKYRDLRGTPYQEQINEFLLNEGAPEFPFPLDLSDLNNYWTAEK
jgi:hypothetical protein